MKAMLLMCLTITSYLFAEGTQKVESKESSKNPQNMFAGNLMPAPVGGSFKMKDYIIWGGSVIQGDDGRYYMFATRWPKAVGMANWVLNSEVVLASSDTAEGPYTFEKVVLAPRGPAFWDGMVTHNPTIRRHNGKYVLFYTGTTYGRPMPTEPAAREFYEQTWNDKRIGVALADSPFGPWTRMDQPILQPRAGKWDAAITSNPAPVIHEDGSVLMIYKSAPVPFPEWNKEREFNLGVAVAPHYLGPYTRINDDAKVRVVGLEGEDVEDPFIWQADGYYHMVAKIFGRKLWEEANAGFYAYSSDGITWTLPEDPKAYSRDVLFTNGEVVKQTKLERPQVLIENGKPTHIFFATADHGWDEIYNLVIPLKSNKSE